MAIHFKENTLCMFINNLTIILKLILQILKYYLYNYSIIKQIKS